MEAADELRALKERLDEVETQLAIHRLMADYAWAMDTGDPDAVVATMTDDAVLIEDVFEETPDRSGRDVHEGREAIWQWARNHMDVPDFAGRQHHADQIVIDGAGDERTVRAFVLVTKCQPDAPYVLRFVGSYEDTVVRTGGRWLFRQRILRLWTGVHLEKFPHNHNIRLPRHPDFVAMDRR